MDFHGLTSMPISILDLLILACATWRLAYFVARESGPFGSAKFIRERLPLGGLTTCIKCASFWTALLMLVLYVSPLRVIVLVFAVSGAALMIASYTGANHGD